MFARLLILRPSVLHLRSAEQDGCGVIGWIAGFKIGNTFRTRTKTPDDFLMGCASMSFSASRPESFCFLEVAFRDCVLTRETQQTRGRSETS